MKGRFQLVAHMLRIGNVSKLPHHADQATPQFDSVRVEKLNLLSAIGLACLLRGRRVTRLCHAQRVTPVLPLL